MDVPPPPPTGTEPGEDGVCAGADVGDAPGLVDGKPGMLVELDRERVVGTYMAKD